MRQDIYPDQLPAPLTPGYCLVGTVRALGGECTVFQPGDTVAVLTKYDAQAELVNQPEKYCTRVAEGLDY
jgi:NADPH:quinone reductase-like Zn-dependent oxidoreductase